jgi:hypothetical protein
LLDGKCGGSKSFSNLFIINLSNLLKTPLSYVVILGSFVILTSFKYYDRSFVFNANCFVYTIYHIILYLLQIHNNYSLLYAYAIIAIMKLAKPSNYETALRGRILHAIHWQFVLLIAYAASIIAFDSWNLITHEVVAKRWTYAGVMAILTVITWFILKKYAKSKNSINALTYLLITANIFFSTINVYTQRGMASKAVMLYVIPLLIASKTSSKITLWATAGLSICAYTIASVRYFHLFYGEGYRIELYGEVGFYSALILIIAGILSPAIKKR